MVEIGRRVRVEYTGYFDDGAVFDSTKMHGGEPLEFLVGCGQMIAGFDKAVCEMTLGEKRTVHVPCEMAYGEYRDDLVEKVPCSLFPGWEKLPVGEYVVLRLGEEAVRMKVLKIEDGEISFDKNHELAGKDVNFDIELVYVHGESGSLIEREQVSGCACGCDELKHAIDPRYSHDHGDACGCGCGGEHTHGHAEGAC